MAFRRPTADEARLLRELASIAEIEDADAWLENLRVREMEDGGMGSLEIDAPASQSHGPGVTVCRAAVQFTDADGVEVVASLNAREDGVPSELDMWKTDFAKLIRIPRQFRRVRE